MNCVSPIIDVGVYVDVSIFDKVPGLIDDIIIYILIKFNRNAQSTIRISFANSRQVCERVDDLRVSNPLTNFFQCLRAIQNILIKRVIVFFGHRLLQRFKLLSQFFLRDDFSSVCVSKLSHNKYLSPRQAGRTAIFCYFLCFEILQDSKLPTVAVSHIPNNNRIVIFIECYSFKL